MKPRVGLALGGGGAKGYAHIGILKGLSEMGIVPSCIAGTSAGGIVAVLYSMLKNPDEIEKRIKELQSSKEFQNLNISEPFDRKNGNISKIFSEVREKILLAKSLVTQALIEDNDIQEVYRHLLGKDVFLESLKPKLLITAVDLVSGRDIVFKGGNALRIIRATSSIPGVFSPVKLGDMLLVDGGITHNVPVFPLVRERCDVIIAIDVSHRLPIKKIYKNPAEVLIRTEYISLERLQDYEETFADIVIHIDLNNYNWYNFEKMEEIIPKGYEAFQKHRDQLEKIMSPTYYMPKNLKRNKKLEKALTENIVYFP